MTDSSEREKRKAHRGDEAVRLAGGENAVGVDASDAAGAYPFNIVLPGNWICGVALWIQHSRVILYLNHDRIGWIVYLPV